MRMMHAMRNKENPNDLTADEIALLRSASTPAYLKNYVGRQPENMGTKASLATKAASAARADAELLQALLALDVARGEVATITAARAEAVALRRERDELVAAVSRKDAELMRVAATPALVVHSTD